MAQSQLSSSWLGRPDGAAQREATAAVGEQALDIWSQLPAARVIETPTAAPARTLGTSIADVLSAWRAAERKLDEHVEASPMRSFIQAEIARLRAEYQRLFAQAMR